MEPNVLVSISLALICCQMEDFPLILKCICLTPDLAILQISSRRMSCVILGPHFFFSIPFYRAQRRSENIEDWY